MESIVSVRDVSVTFGRKKVLTNIYLEVLRGKIYGVLGPNGAGKSTLFKVILGLLKADHGEVSVFGQPIEDVRQQVVYIPQKENIDWDFPATVEEVVLMGRYPHKKLWQRINSQDKKMAMQAMEQLDIHMLKDRQIGELSGGQQQRTFIARALCQDADLFLLDEPFVGVDVTTEERIVQILHSQVLEGKTFLVVHHDLSTAPEYFDHAILLNQRLIAAGAMADVFDEENLRRTYSGQLTLLQKSTLIH